VVCVVAVRVAKGAPGFLLWPNMSITVSVIVAAK
jgi:hypothetical protein